MTGALVGALLVASLAVPAASAATPNVVNPAPGTVRADALPTTQIDGVAWDQVIAGGKVYVGGSFGNARPAGAAPGTAQTARHNMLAYDLATGTLDGGFDPDLNGQARVVTTSPDGKRLYVGGSFTKVGGVNRYRIAAFDTASGALVASFAPQVDFTVNAIAATNSTVYIGGAFSRSGATVRNRLAAFRAVDGALLPWAPSADAGVTAMTVTPDGSAVIVGGSFKTINGSPAYGLARLGSNSGNLQPWAAGAKIRNAGADAAITSLSTDGTAIYGSGYAYGTGGNLEGAFSADPSTGAIRWVEDCHGDTYDTWAGKNAVYTVSHAHNCQNVGGFPDSNPTSVNMRRTMAFTVDARTTVAHEPGTRYFDWYGTPAPAIQNWFPDLAPGSYTGKTQAAWTVTGNDTYVVMGGEFPTVNGVGQQGLVRFATKGTSPTKVGPTFRGTPINPTVVPIVSGVRVTWPANSDRDDKTLTYTLTRDGQPVYQTTADSTFWDRPTLSFIDRGPASGATAKYRLRVADPDGNTVQSDIVDYTAASGGAGPNPYQARVVADGASAYWPMNEASGATLVDNIGTADAIATGPLTRGVMGAIGGDPATGFAAGATAGTSSTQAGPRTFTLQAWINTTTTSGGKILGFGTAQSGLSGSYDRHLYLDNAGRVFFGVHPGFVATVNSAAGLNDGKWHQITASLGADGMKLFVDGRQVAARADITSAQDYPGYWRIGGDNVGGWPNQPASPALTGSIDEVAIYPSVLTPAAIAAQWTISGAGVVPNQAPKADFALTASDLTATVSGAGSRDGDGSIASYSWDFGDGSTGTGRIASHTYTSAGTRTITLTVTDDKGATDRTSRQVDLMAPNQQPTAAFTAAATGGTVSFDGRASGDPDGRIGTWAWDFGDGSTGSGATVSHVYSGAGPHTVTLKVTDDRGLRAVTTRTVG